MDNVKKELEVMQAHLHIVMNRPRTAPINSTMKDIGGTVLDILDILINDRNNNTNHNFDEQFKMLEKARTKPNKQEIENARKYGGIKDICKQVVHG